MLKENTSNHSVSWITFLQLTLASTFVTVYLYFAITGCQLKVCVCVCACAHTRLTAGPNWLTKTITRWHGWFQPLCVCTGCVYETPVYGWYIIMHSCYNSWCNTTKCWFSCFPSVFCCCFICLFICFCTCIHHKIITCSLWRPLCSW